ncbi:hypothetical protein T01_2956 [Trichinella spiralis]|uniref:Uncharacterized protein n=1 Tax=Trichinella spiralis TaxID=6334 RepID=A0A0V1BYX1_TRISP|nr:hypothetical protein T01_2956 [Trichinella spiralis]
MNSCSQQCPNRTLKLNYNFFNINEVISALMWAKNVQLQTNTFRANQRRRPIESILLQMQIGGKTCPAPMNKLCEKVGEEIEQAHKTCYISSAVDLDARYFFKELHNLGLPVIYNDKIFN